MESYNTDKILAQIQAATEKVEDMTAASMRALDMPGGEQVLQDIIDKKISVDDGIAKLLVMSGDYEYKPGQGPKEDN